MQWNEVTRLLYYQHRIYSPFFRLSAPKTKGDDIRQYAFDAKSWSQCIDAAVELKHVFRQKDEEFASLLSRIRVGVCTPADVKVLQETRHHSLDYGDGVVATQLCTHIKEAARINEMYAPPGAAHTRYAVLVLHA